MQEKGVSLIQATKSLWVNIKLNVRLSLIAAYYVCLGVIGLISLTYYGANSNVGIRTLTDYFLCESIATENCPVDLIEISTIRTFSVVMSVMVSLIPVVTLLFTIEPCKWCKKRESSPAAGQESKV